MFSYIFFKHALVFGEQNNEKITDKHICQSCWKNTNRAVGLSKQSRAESRSEKFVVESACKAIVHVEKASETPASLLISETC